MRAESLGVADEAEDVDSCRAARRVVPAGRTVAKPLDVGVAVACATLDVIQPPAGPCEDPSTYRGPPRGPSGSADERFV